MGRKKIILIGLLVLLGASIGYRAQHPFEQKRISQLKYAPNKAKKISPKTQKKDKSPKEDAVMREDLLLVSLFLNPVKHSGNVNRDPFFKKLPERKKVLKRTASLQKKPKSKRHAEDPIQRVKRELCLYRVFGSFESNGEQALFIERGRDILVVREGDWIDGKFQLKDISSDSITIWAGEIGQEVRIALEE